MNLYRTKWFHASVAVLLACTLVLSASAFQRRAAHKLRATGLLEVITAPNGKVTTRLTPITILADGSFQDASIYESRPRPMALGDGVVYEAQKTGVPVGYVTINGASQTLDGWVAEGRWQLVSQVHARATSKPSPPPTSADDRPILHRGSGDSSQPSSPKSDQSQPQSQGSDDRPVLHRGGDNGQQPSSTSDQTQTQPQPQQSGDDRPVLHRSGEENPQQPQPQTTSQNPPANTTTQSDSTQEPDDPDRPVLRHRSPASDQGEAIPARPGANVPSTTSQPSQPAPVPTPGVQTYVAVSDAAPEDTRSFEYHWKPGEEAKIEAKMRKLALAQLPGENAQAIEHAMTNVVIRSFDLDLSNDAVVVITAEVPAGYLAKGTKAAPGKFVSRYITVIARTDIDGNPQKLAASVTDSSRLDVAPRLELIDAVDVDGDGLAELLFREYDFDQKSFIVYGVGHGTVTKVFEGASEPINK
jgi:hypothetical protein